MPKVGMEPVRRQQLIDATIESVAQKGYKQPQLIVLAKMRGCPLA